MHNSEQNNGPSGGVAGRILARLRANRRIGVYLVLVGGLLLAFSSLFQNSRDVVLYVVLTEVGRGRLGECNRETFTHLELAVLKDGTQQTSASWTFELGAPPSLELPVNLPPAEYQLRGVFSCNEKRFMAQTPFSIESDSRVVVHLR